MTAARDATIADLRAEIAALRAERDAATTRHQSASSERISHQAATIDVLKAMSASPGDAQPVFDLICQQVKALLGTVHVTLFEYDGQMVHLRATHGTKENFDAASIDAYVSDFPMLPDRGSITCRAILDGTMIHILDLAAEPGLSPAVRKLGHKTQVTIPLMRDRKAIGAITTSSFQVDGITDTQVQLLQTFAEQAVIAITSAETYRALQNRTADLQESLEQQSATAEVLKVISRSTFDLLPVLHTVAETAARLCNADQAMVDRYENGMLEVLANFGFPPEFEAYQKKRGRFPADKDSPASSSRAIHERRTIHIEDVAAVPGYSDAAIRLGKQRTSLAVPLLRQGEPIGVIVLARQRVLPFTHRQIELVQSFADQAAIAIENARLLTEQREALEQQTATAEVLGVINASPGDLAPVFDAMLERALRLCGAAFGMFYTFDGDRFHIVAARGVPAAFEAYRRQHPMRANPDTPPGQAILTRRPVQVEDVMTHPFFVANPQLQDIQIRLGGIRAVLNLPLLKDGMPCGMFVIYRAEPGAFPARQIALLESFAAQAVIAMENARLLGELRERNADFAEQVAHQDATIDVLKAMSASPGDAQPVFEAIVARAIQICGTPNAALLIRQDNMVHFRAAANSLPERAEAMARYRAQFPRPLDDSSVAARAIRDARVVHIRNFDVEPGIDPVIRSSGDKSILAVPMLRDGQAVGVIVTGSVRHDAFTDSQAELLKTFAEQAVIAMRSAEAYQELEEALAQQTATAEVLQVINASPGDLTPVFEAILEKAHVLCGAEIGALTSYDGEFMRAVAVRGLSAEHSALITEPFRPSPGGGVMRLVGGARFSQMADMLAEHVPGFSETFARRTGLRTYLGIPLRKDGVFVGQISAYRREVRPFAEKEIALLENFAAQAVIAMDNARLLTELRESLEQQTAMTDVLRVINLNPGDVQPVFDAVLARAHRMCKADLGALGFYDGRTFRVLSAFGYPPETEAFLRAGFPTKPFHEPLFRGERAYVPDREELTLPGSGVAGWMDPVAREELLDYLRQAGINTHLMVPLYKDGTLLGFISAARHEPRPFSEKEIALLENFAAQSVIAMENARLLNEQRDALERQTATADIMRAINTNPGDPGPVFNLILEKAHTLCGSDVGSLGLYDGTHFRKLALRGYSQDVDARLRRPYPPLTVHDPLLRGESIHIADVANYHFEPDSRAAIATHISSGLRAWLEVPLWNNGKLAGTISGWRYDPRPFSDKEIALLENFTEQAVIAMDNARLLNEIRQRQSELNITFENMGDGVAMFDAEHNLAAWNRNFQVILDLPDDAVRVGLPFADYIRALAEKGEYGPDANADEQIARLTVQLGQPSRFERTRPNGHVIDIRQNPIPGGGFVVIYADITERKHAEEALRTARDAAENALRDLRAAQASLVQAEKMASLGQLTAGIAHEIKNPLNFVNNFAALSVELLGELKETAAPVFATLDDGARNDIDHLTTTLTSNLSKIEEQGKRADGIVKSMLEHSRASSGERRVVDLNALVDEAMNLAYHGARAQDQSFNITLEQDLAPDIAPVTLAPQEMTRVLLNLCSNGFYAARKREQAEPGFVPVLRVTTRDLGEAVEIKVRDNGVGVSPEIRDKLFQPFFTTKPTGEGTGLGLSITWDIVTKQHGGTIAVDSEVGGFTEFTVTLPRQMAARA